MALPFLTLPALADDLASRDWSVTAAQTLDRYAPEPGDLEATINRTLDTQWNMGVCSAKFVDVFDGTYRLVALLDVNGRHICNRLVVIEKTREHFHAVNDLQVVLADNVTDMLIDLDGDHSPELVATTSWSRPENGSCTATWQKVYKWQGGRFVDRSADYPKYYKDRLKDLQKTATYERDPSCHQMEMDRIARFLGTPKTGFDRAATWMTSPDAARRRKAATVFADIGDDSSKKNLALLAKDADPLTAESARLYLDSSGRN